MIKKLLYTLLKYQNTGFWAKNTKRNVEALVTENA